MKQKTDNDNLYNSFKKAFEERQGLNSKILVLEQISSEGKLKESDNVLNYQEQVKRLKDQLEKKTYLLDIKTKYFNELHSFTASIIPNNSKALNQRF